MMSIEWILKTILGVLGAMLITLGIVLIYLYRSKDKWKK